MNKYITALPVVPVVTRAEAQSYQPALEIALGDINIEDLYRKQALKGAEQEILSVLEVFKQIKEDEEAEPAQSKAVFVTDLCDNYSIAPISQSNNNQEPQLFPLNPFLRTGIRIRVPSLFPLA